MLINRPGAINISPLRGEEPLKGGGGMKRLLAVLVTASMFLLIPVSLLLARQPQGQPTAQQLAQQAATNHDHQRMMELLKITSLRPGADGRNADAPNAANYDEAKANPYPKLPEPLLLKNGKRVTSAKTWWNKRRPEIVEDFDREIYGRIPKNTPKVKWEITSTTNEKNGDVPVITKKLAGHVDNSAVSQITVDIQLTLTTPANATGPVPVFMEFGFIFPPGFPFLRDFVCRHRHLDQPGNNKFWLEAGVTPA